MKKIIVIISLIIWAWGIFSWVDIISDNNEPNPQHSDLNIFVLLYPTDEKN